MTRLGKFIQARRKKLRMTQKSLATMLGVSASYLSDVEHGHRPGINLVKRLSSALMVDEDYLSYLVGLWPRNLVALELTEEQVTKLTKHGKENP